MAKNIVNQKYKVTRHHREAQQKHSAKVIWFTGLSGAGKSTLANLLEQQLHKQGYRTYVLDGDNLRFGLNKDLGFSKDERRENLRRAAEVAKLFADAGIVVLAAFISPYEEDRVLIKNIVGEKDFLHIYVECPIDICEQRDEKGLYAKVRNGEIRNFTGISAPFEEPKQFDFKIDTSNFNKEVCVKQLLEFVKQEIGDSF